MKPDKTYRSFYGGHLLHECQECGWRGNVVRNNDGIWRCHECNRVHHQKKEQAAK